MPKTTVNVDALYAALDRKRDLNKKSWRDVAQELDLSPSTFTRMANGLRPDTDTFASLLDWLEMPADSFMSPPRPAGATAEPEPMVAIASYLRSSKKITRKQAEALENVFQAAYKSIVTK